MLAEIERLNADRIVSFGGGSPIDSSKVAAYAVLNGRDPLAAALAAGSAPSAAEMARGREITHLAVPTTLSAGEYTHVAGVTDESTRVKEGVGDPRILARTVINDPLLTLETPDWLWIATGMRALDHAIESIYSTRHQLLSDTLASKAIELLNAHLAVSIRTTGAERTRASRVLPAGFLVFNFRRAEYWLRLVACPGPSDRAEVGVPHGITSCITLPHVMRFMAGMAPQRFGPIRKRDSASPSIRRTRKPGALTCADRTAGFIAQFDVHRRLRDSGAPKDQIGEIAGTIEHHFARLNVVDRPVARAEILRPPRRRVLVERAPGGSFPFPAWGKACTPQGRGVSCFADLLAA